MTKRNRLTAAVAALVAILFVVATMTAFFQRVERRRVFRPAGGESKAEAPKVVPPVAQWSSTFRELSGDDLAALLDRIEREHRDLYAQWDLAYLHARALIEADRGDEAIRKLEPFLANDHPFRDLALYHRAELADGAEASRWRRMLVAEHPRSIYREEGVDEEIAYLTERGDPAALVAFAREIAPSASTERRRDVGARIVAALVDSDPDAALARGLDILRGGIGDDAADLVTRALDEPSILRRLSLEQRALFGETFQRHRHYDRAIDLLGDVVRARYSDDLQYALGRAYFGAERFEEAQAAYLRGAAATRSPARQSTFYWHAARAAQLRGDDRTAETLMTRAIAVKGTHPATLAALTQRLRTRVNAGRLAEAGSDLALLRRMAPNRSAVADGALAYAVGLIAAGRTTAGIATLDSVPSRLLDDYGEAEFAYWRARALEERDPAAAFRAYLEVLRAEVPTHFAYFARRRLDSPAMAPKLARELAAREAQVRNLVAEEKFELAKRLQTDRILLSSNDRAAQLEILGDIYRRLPDYREILELQPQPLPAFPNVDPRDPSALLMAMGLFDEAVPAVEDRWGLRPAREALTRSYALNLGAASRQSIYAIEVMMRSVPDDFHPYLLPELAQRLLYPRYFYDAIVADAERYDADPRLVLSIMREESRFNPRAKSQAAARGLLQFIITTARDIGREVGLVDVAPEDLYDPRIIIRLGAKYISQLSDQLGDNRYRTAAAYNAGPQQSALWTRMQPAPGDDYFLTAVNFDETKHYVRKVMNSYERYQAIYGDQQPTGGLRVEP